MILPLRSFHTPGGCYRYAAVFLVSCLSPLLLPGAGTGKAAEPNPAFTHATSEPDRPAITPRERIALFNGKDLSGFTAWEVAHGIGDPDHVFTVVDQIDGAPAIRASGQYFGGLITKERYTNYRLVVEFRWGLVTWAGRKDRARDNGILLHCQGEPGNSRADFRGPWMRSIEAQIIEGGTGDILVLSGFERGNPKAINSSLKATVNGKNWSPDGKLTEFTRGRIDWQYRDLAWKDVLGFRGGKDVEKPVGEWNRYEIVADGGNLTYFLNGVKVNAATDCSLTEGRILFQSEGAELYFRLIELHPLQK